jgi:hypothetical protein
MGDRVPSPTGDLSQGIRVRRRRRRWTTAALVRRDRREERGARGWRRTGRRHKGVRVGP